MCDFEQFLKGAALVTVAVVIFSMAFGIFQYLLGRYGFEIVLVAFVAFVIWIS